MVSLGYRLLLTENKRAVSRKMGSQRAGDGRGDPDSVRRYPSFLRMCTVLPLLEHLVIQSEFPKPHATCRPVATVRATPEIILRPYQVDMAVLCIA